MSIRGVIGTVAGILTFALPPSTAFGGELQILRGDGRTVERRDPGVDQRDRTSAAHLGERALAGARRPGADRRARRRGSRGPAPSARAAARRRTVGRELRRLYAGGLIDRETYASRLAGYRSFSAAVERFSGRRRIDMAGVRRLVRRFAARGAFTPSRLPALWMTMERNRQWWNAGPLLVAGQRVGFEGSELVWQYLPGQGLQLHPLANAGKLNALWRARRGAGRMEVLLDELLALPAERAGGLAWEYLFDYGGGRGPWVSGLAQGTLLQAVARAAARAGRTAEVLPLARRGLGVFGTAPPEGVRVRGDRGSHYLQYSFAPSLRILNGFVQSLVGLHDFAQHALDVEAQELYLDGLAAARAEVPAFDTGAWSLYSRGSSTRESDLHYHLLLRDFLTALCDRTPEPVFCDTEDRFTAYLAQPPALRLVTRRVRAKRAGTLAFEVSKVSRVRVRAVRGRRTLLDREAVVGRGRTRHRIRVPRRRGTLAVSLSATDLAGNASAVDGTVRVLPARRR